jgi:hypothetical protein
MAIATAPTPRMAVTTAESTIHVVSHSNLFYWWPVWFTGFILAILTFVSGTDMVFVPHDSVALKDAAVSGEKDGKPVVYPKVDVLVVQHGHLPAVDGHLDQPHLHAANSGIYGVLFALVLLVVIFITNVPLRGMWSGIVITVAVLGSIIFQLAGWWEPILSTLSFLDIRINGAGYLLISSVLLGVWLFTVLLFDRQIYMTFSPGQMRVCTEIGGGEKVYDAGGMTLEKQRSDLFRHWLLGMGSGDLIVRTSGAQAHQIDMPNVLFISAKVRQIEEMLKSKSVVEAPH